MVVSESVERAKALAFSILDEIEREEPNLSETDIYIMRVRLANISSFFTLNEFTLLAYDFAKAYPSQKERIERILSLLREAFFGTQG